MTREEELIRIAKKLDKMVSRNNTVRYLFGRLLHVVVLGFVLWLFFFFMFKVSTCILF